MFLKIKAILLLSRPFMTIVIAWSTIVGVLLTKENIPLVHLIIIAFTELFVASGGFLFNDFVDYKQDKINHPQSLLIKGVIKRMTAVGVAIPCFLFGVLLSSKSVCSNYTFAFIITQSFLLIAYPHLKKISAILGNILTALLCASGFAYGALTVGKIGLAWFPVLITFIFVFGREIIKDVHDVVGDEAVGIKSIPILYGEKTARTIAAITTLFCMLLLCIPILIKNYTQPYLITMTIAQILLIISIILLSDKSNTKNFLDLTAAIFIIVLLAFTFGL